MQKKVIVFCLVMMCYCSIPSADESSSLYLNDGDNDIGFIVSNNILVDLNNLSIITIDSDIPEWLKVELSHLYISIPKGEKSGNKITINFNVENAPSDAEALVPFIIQDGKGNKWNFSIKVHTNSVLPLMNSLENNFPNPFNPTTTIKFSIKENIYTKLIIYNSIGQKVKTLVDSPKSVGVYSVHWNGCNENGQKVSSGVYFYKLEAGNFVKTKRMMLLE